MLRKTKKPVPEMDEDGAYPKWVKVDIKEQNKNGEHEINELQAILTTRQRYLGSLGLMFFYVGFLSVTVTYLIFSL
jgi:hypothetical protein